MKKVMVALFTIILCIGLYACGGGKDIELPTKPVQAAAPNQSVVEPQSSAHAAEENAKAAEPTGETYPWEAEFNEEDYTRIEVPMINGETIITWRKDNILGRDVRKVHYQSDGSVHECYYYPSGNTSHSCLWGSDGIYTECHYLDNGYFDKSIGLEHFGTMVYVKTIHADSSWSEVFIDENENQLLEIQQNADGTYHEHHYFPDGTLRKTLNVNPNTGERIEAEYFKDQSTKYDSYTSKEYAREERFDEEGFRTYYYMKGSDLEQECIADETGKLVKVIENGSEIQNPAIIAQYAKDYNFKE